MLLCVSLSLTQTFQPKNFLLGTHACPVLRVLRVNKRFKREHNCKNARNEASVLPAGVKGHCALQDDCITAPENLTLSHSLSIQFK